MKRILFILLLLPFISKAQLCSDIDTVLSARASSVGLSTATITGTAGGSGGVSWTLKYVRVGHTDTVTTSSSSITKNLTGLVSNTQYTFRYTTFCGTGYAYNLGRKYFTTTTNSVAYTPMTDAGYQFKGIKADSSFALPFRDTSNGRWTTRPGTIVCNYLDSNLYRWTGLKWSPIAIDSTGFVDRLNHKVDSVTIASDSLFYWINGTAYGQVFSALGWGTTGNSGTDPATNFWGTTDNKGLALRTNNSRRLLVSNTGDFTFGDNAGGHRLESYGYGTNNLWQITTGTNSSYSAFDFISKDFSGDDFGLSRFTINPEEGFISEQTDSARTTGSRLSQQRGVFTFVGKTLITTNFANTATSDAVLTLDSAHATLYGSQLKFKNGTPPTTPEIGSMNFKNGLWYLDSSNSVRDTIATRRWARNNIISSGGTVTSVATGYGLSGGTITTTGTLIADTSILVNKTGVQTITNKTINGANNSLTVRLANDVTGVLPITNGGTNNGSLSVTNGNLYYGDGTKLVGLGIGTTKQTLHVVAGIPAWVDTAATAAQVYPGAGIANSTGSAWGTSYTTTGSGTVVALQTSPTFVTNITTPLVIGGTGTTSTLTLQPTNGVGTTGSDIIFKVGNNGGTLIAKMFSDGYTTFGSTTNYGEKLAVVGTYYGTGRMRVDNYGAFRDGVYAGGSNVPLAKIHMAAGSATVNTAPLKFTSGPYLTVDESGTIQFLSGKFKITDSLVIAGNVGIGTTSPTSLLHTAGSFSTGYIAKTANYTATISDHTIEATTGTFTVTLPTAVGVTGRIYVITNSGSGVITVGTTSSQTFVNVVATPTTLTLNQFATVTVQSNGANWLRITSL